MIVLSLVLVVASAAALGWGIATTSAQLIWGSLLAGLAATALVVSSVVRYRRRLSAAETSASTPAPGVPPAVPAAGSWPWPAEPATPDAPRSGWTGPVSPPPRAGNESAPAGTAEEPPPPAAPAGGQPAAGTAGAASQAAGPAGAPGAPAGPRRAEQPFATALGASTDRPLGEPFPEPPPDDGEPPVEDVPIRDALRAAQLDDDVQVVDGHPRYHLAACPTLAGTEPVPLPVSAARRAGFTPCAICAPDRTLLDRSRDRRPPAAS